MHTHSRVYIHTRISELYTIFNTLYYYLIPLSLVFYPSPSMTGLILSPSLCLGVAPRRVASSSLSSSSFVFLTPVFPRAPFRRDAAGRGVPDASRLPSTNRSCAFAVLSRESNGLRLRVDCLYVNRLFTFSDNTQPLSLCFL